jgi:hypothetical protein
VASLDGEEQSSGKRENSSSSQLREDKAEGGARGGDTAWPARGGGAAAWPRVASVMTRQPARSVRRLVPLTCVPSGLFEFPMIFNHSNFEIQNSDLPDVQNSLNFS